jgi:hypothetical protein
MQPFDGVNLETHIFKHREAVKHVHYFPFCFCIYQHPKFGALRRECIACDSAFAHQFVNDCSLFGNESKKISLRYLPPTNNFLAPC